MNDFTASNGGIVRSDGHPFVMFNANGMVTHTFSASEAQALREFFQAEADERLGRWRWPQHPNWACYPTTRAHEVVVFNEDEPECGTQTLSRGGDTWPYYRPAADAFFDAHPEPKSLPNEPGLYTGAHIDGQPSVWWRHGDGSWLPTA